MKTRTLVLGIVQICVLALLFTLAFRSGFWQAAIYLLVLSGASIPMSIYLLRKDPGLLERRARGPQHEKETSQKILHVVVLLSFASAIVVAAFDHYYLWSHVSPAIAIAGDAVVALGLLAYYVVFRENTYAGSTIDIASDQKVISTGPYAIVRHPMYVGLLAVAAGTPVALGSWWGLLFLAPLFLALARRISYEERVLLESLPGYANYCEKVRYRLVPFAW